MYRGLSAKQSALELLHLLPDDATYEDIMYGLYIRAAVDEGIRQADAGQTVSHEEVMREMRKWLTEATGKRAAEDARAS